MHHLSRWLDQGRWLDMMPRVRVNLAIRVPQRVRSGIDVGCLVTFVLAQAVDGLAFAGRERNLERFPFVSCPIEEMTAKPHAASLTGLLRMMLQRVKSRFACGSPFRSFSVHSASARCCSFQIR